jgi:hypothetical protein
MKIIAKFQCDLYGVVLGFNEGRFKPWTTLRFNTNLKTHSPGYYWGHYFKESCNAIDDFFERCKGLIEFEHQTWFMEINEQRIRYIENGNIE